MEDTRSYSRLWRCTMQMRVFFICKHHNSSTSRVFDFVVCDGHIEKLAVPADVYIGVLEELCGSDKCRYKDRIGVTDVVRLQNRSAFEVRIEESDKDGAVVLTVVVDSE